MVIALWRCSNRRWSAVTVQSLGGRPTSVLRYWFICRDLLGHRALGGLAFRQRRHRRAGGAGRDRRLAFLVAATEANIGKALQQRQPSLLRMLLCRRLAAGLANLGLRGHR